MKQFFEQYGAVALGILALLVLIAMITPVGNLVKTSLQGTVQTFSAGIESQSNAIDFVTIDSGTRIKIGNRHYIVIENMGMTSFKVLENNYSLSLNWGYGVDQLYENSWIDTYLQANYYNSLPNDIKEAIVETTIKQDTYKRTMYKAPNFTDWSFKPGTLEGIKSIWYNEGTSESPNWVTIDEHIPDNTPGLYPSKSWEKTDGFEDGTTTIPINRLVYLPSVEELQRIFDLDNQLAVYNILMHEGDLKQGIWTRDGYWAHKDSPMHINTSTRSLYCFNGNSNYKLIFPTYALDLSKVSFTIE